MRRGNSPLFLPYPPGEQQIATRCMMVPSSLFAFTDLSVSYRFQHFCPRSASNIRLAYNNFYSTNAGDIDGPNPITVTASIELPLGTLMPLTFNGQLSAQISPGGTVYSDPLGITIPDLTFFYTRTCVSVSTSGHKWPVGMQTIPANNEGNNRPSANFATSPDATQNTATTFSVQQASYGPCAILGIAKSYLPNVAYLGDSIANGSGDIVDTGFIVRAINNSLGYIGMARGGERLQHLQPGQPSSGRGRSRRFSQLRRMGITNVIVQNGRNDLVISGNTLTVLQTNARTIWNHLSNLSIKVYGVTIPPTTTSTDVWATTTNQAADPTYDTNNIRTTYNDWLRGVPAPLSAVFDIADLLETSRNSGIWKANHTGDGVHPNQTGHIAAAAAVNTALFQV